LARLSGEQGFFFMDKPLWNRADAFGIDDAHQTEQQLISASGATSACRWWILQDDKTPH
jgi:hypothetical protein